VAGGGSVPYLLVALNRSGPGWSSFVEETPRAGAG
jgi:hypothetical protein